MRKGCDIPSNISETLPEPVDVLERRGLHALLPRLFLGVFQGGRRALWRIFRPRSHGVRGICLDADGRIILVKHSYMRGWFLPGGAPRAGEHSAGALLRELREELGMISCERILPLFDVEQISNYKRDKQEVFLVEGISCSSKLSIEIEAIGLFDIKDLPRDLHASTAYKIARWMSPESDWSNVAVPEEC